MVMTLSCVHRTAGEKAERSPAQETINVLGGCVGKGLRSGWVQPSNRRREEAANARQRINRRAKGEGEAGQPLRE